MSLKSLISSVLNLGNDHHSSPIAQRRTRLLNAFLFLGMAILLPTVFILNILDSNIPQVALAFVGLVTCLGSLWLNARGKTTNGGILLFLMVMVLTVFAVALSPIQTAAPYTNFLVGIGALYLFPNRTMKIAIFAFSIALFTGLNFYQLLVLPFEPWDYLPVVPTLVLMVVGLSFADLEIIQYQNRIELQNEQLQDQNLTIQHQSELLLRSEKERHEQAIKLKQKDLEDVLENNNLQVRFRNRIIAELEKIRKSKELEKDLGSVLSDLKQEVKAFEKVNHFSQNIEETNSSLARNLMEKHPDITSSELEICLLVKLGLSSKEIGSFRNTTDNTINVLKTRIRKKIGLDSNKELRKYLLTI